MAAASIEPFYTWMWELYHFDIPLSCLFGEKNDLSEWQRVSKPSDVAEGLIVVSST